MKTTIDLLKDAVAKNGVAVNDGAMFELLDSTLCTKCCGDCCGGNDDCPPKPVEV